MKWFSKKYEWKRWFAWHPTEIEDGKYVWLEFIWRQRVNRATLYPFHRIYIYKLNK